MRSLLAYAGDVLIGTITASVLVTVALVTMQRQRPSFADLLGGAAMLGPGSLPFVIVGSAALLVLNRCLSRVGLTHRRRSAATLAGAPVLGFAIAVLLSRADGGGLAAHPAFFGTIGAANGFAVALFGAMLSS